MSAGELEQYRSYLTRIARRHLRDEHLVQDLVQETLLAALLAADFTGASSVRTWLAAILNHKVVDAIRKRQRRPELLASQLQVNPNGGVEDYESAFDKSGNWEPKQVGWGDPEQALRQRELFDAVACCMETLPSNTARVFMMREYMDLEISEISRELSTTAGNVYVMLFRGRAALRRCLERRWSARRPART